MDDFTARLDALDLTLFAAIPSESHEGDRRAWLACQRLVRRQDGYVYLEIGSHLGGSIQQHLPDPLCRNIISIDSRPPAQPDDRGQTYPYPDNTTARMMENLSRAVQPGPSKDAPRRVDITCYDSDARDVDPASLPAVPDLCFIDGEHTAHAVESDFGFCLRVCSPAAVVLFHDDIVIWRTLAHLVAQIDQHGIPFVARKFEGGDTFGVFFRSSGPAALADPLITSLSVDGRRWLRSRRLRSLVPRPLRQVVRWARRQLGR